MSSKAREWLAPAIVAVATFAAFLPVLWNSFVSWDDYDNVVNNPYLRLGWPAYISWMFTTFYTAMYQPLIWASWRLDYSIWGMNPAGYHLTNLVLHSASAVFFYFICRRFLTLPSGAILPNPDDDWRLTVGAGFAALLFALHPLRVESVAWVTERKDVLSGFFFLWAIYCYLKTNSDSSYRSRRWLIMALFAYVLSLMSKAHGITLPVVLLILDIYPLRRLQWNPRKMVFARSSARVAGENTICLFCDSIWPYPGQVSFRTLQN
jgi:protein O-mannosyl-transferase